MMKRMPIPVGIDEIAKILERLNTEHSRYTQIKYPEFYRDHDGSRSGNFTLCVLECETPGLGKQTYYGLAKRDPRDPYNPQMAKKIALQRALDGVFHDIKVPHKPKPKKSKKADGPRATAVEVPKT